MLCGANPGVCRRVGAGVNSNERLLKVLSIVKVIPKENARGPNSNSKENGTNECKA